MAAYNKRLHGRKAQSSVCKKKNGSPLPLMGPVLKKRPNWLSQRKNRMPETFCRSNTVFSGCASNWSQRHQSSGSINTAHSTRYKYHRHCNNCFQSFCMAQWNSIPPPMGISTKGPLVIIASPVKKAAGTIFHTFPPAFTRYQDAPI